jgi:hypothetical protein
MSEQVAIGCSDWLERFFSVIEVFVSDQFRGPNGAECVSNFLNQRLIQAELTNIVTSGRVD